MAAILIWGMTMLVWVDTASGATIPSPCKSMIVFHMRFMQITTSGTVQSSTFDGYKKFKTLAQAQAYRQSVDHFLAVGNSTWTWQIFNSGVIQEQSGVSASFGCE